MNHCKAVSVPTMMIRVVKPFHKPAKPICLMISPTDEPLALLSLETRLETNKKRKITFAETKKEKYLSKKSRVSRMAHDGAEHTRNITSSEGHDQLFAFGALLAWLRHNMLLYYKIN